MEGEAGGRVALAEASQRTGFANTVSYPKQVVNFLLFFWCKFPFIKQC